MIKKLDTNLRQGQKVFEALDQMFLYDIQIWGHKWGLFLSKI